VPNLSKFNNKLPLAAQLGEIFPHPYLTALQLASLTFECVAREDWELEHMQADIERK
jgi:hypothetical protein